MITMCPLNGEAGTPLAASGYTPVRVMPGDSYKITMTMKTRRPLGTKVVVMAEASGSRPAVSAAAIQRLYRQVLRLDPLVLG